MVDLSEDVESSYRGVPTTDGAGGDAVGGGFGAELAAIHAYESAQHRQLAKVAAVFAVVLVLSLLRGGKPVDYPLESQL